MTKAKAEEARQWAAIGTRIGEAAKYFQCSAATLRATIRGAHKNPYRND